MRHGLGLGLTGRPANVAAASAPTNTAPPTITGNRYGTQVLTVHQGTYSGTAPITYTYQWTRDGADIGGETGTTYTQSASDPATVIDVIETATNAAGSASATAGGSTITQICSVVPKVWYWVKPSQLFTTAAGSTHAGDGDAVGRIVDLAGNFNATQSTAGSRPVLHADGDGWKLTYDAVDDTLLSAGSTGLTWTNGLHAFLRGRLPLKGDFTVIFGQFVNYGSQAVWMLRDDGSHRGIQVITTSNGGGTDYGKIAANGATETGLYNAIGWYDPAGHIGVRLINDDGDSGDLTAAEGAAPFAGTDPIQFGGAGCGTSLKAGVLYDTYLSADDVELVLAWLDLVA